MNKINKITKVAVIGFEPTIIGSVYQEREL